jgi:hypothetical protein
MVEKNRETISYEMAQKFSNGNDYFHQKSEFQKSLNIWHQNHWGELMMMVDDDGG